MYKSTPLRPGQSARAGRYRCADCGYELRLRDTPSAPPCPRSADIDHQANTWERRGAGLGWLLGAAGLAIAAGVVVHTLGTRRIAADARSLAVEGERLARLGRRRLTRSAREARRWIA